MNAGSIWWGQIGNSLRLLTSVTDALQDCRSAVLQVPQMFPWRLDFYQAIDARSYSFGSEKRLKRLECRTGKDPGQFVLEELCPSTVRAEYWPGQSYAEYLGSRKDIMLNDYYVWISGIHSKSDFAKWVAFVEQYNQVADTLENRAVFILEYDGASVDVSTLDTIVYTVEDYDCRVFCLEAVASLGNTQLREYQAELALCLGDSNPELCDALLNTGKELLRNPVKTACSVLQESRTSEGRNFESRSEQQLISAAWKAAIVLLFPILEQYRLDFIAKNEYALQKHLPITNSNGDRVADPCDLEIGSLQYITCSSGEFSKVDADALRLCKKSRNLLAHNKPIPFEYVERILALQVGKISHRS